MFFRIFTIQKYFSDLKHPFSKFSISQIQLEKDKVLFDFENVQSQLDKALGHGSRVQKEKESIQLDYDRYKEKADKLQVSL